MITFGNNVISNKKRRPFQASAVNPGALL